MRILLILISVILLNCNAFSENGFTFISNGKIVLYDFKKNYFMDIKADYNIFDYAFTSDGLFIVTDSETDGGHYQNNLPPQTHIYFSKISYKNDNVNYKFNEINVKSVLSIETSPNKNYLLIKYSNEILNMNDKINYYYDILKISDNTKKQIIKLKNYEVLGWYSNVELLVITNSKLQLFNIIKNELYDYKNTINLNNYKIVKFNRIDKFNTLFQLKEKNNKFSNKMALFFNSNGISKKLYFIDSHHFEYVINQNNEIYLVEMNNDGEKYWQDLIQLDLDGNVIKKTNLNDFLQIKNKLQKIIISENILNNNIIIFAITPWKSSYYKLNILDLTFEMIKSDDQYFGEVKNLRLF